MSFYRWIVDHPVAVWMVTIAAMVFGLVSYARLPLNLMPDLSYPTLTIRTEYLGAAPEEVEQQVSRPVEEALATVEGLVSLESRSRAGVSDVVLEFDWDTSMHEASQSVREQIQGLYLGDGVGRPLILRYDPSLDPILRIALSGKGPTDSEPVVRAYAEEDLKRQLESIEGVAAVVVRGGLEARVLVEAREDWLAARYVTLDQLSSALTAGNVNMAGGVVREGENEYLIRTLNEVKTLEEIRGLPIPRANGIAVRVGDVAEVKPGFADREVAVRLQGQEAVELQVFKEADANLVTVAARVKAALLTWSEGAEPEGGPEPSTADPDAARSGPKDETTGELKTGFIWKILDDQARFVELSLNNLVDDAVLGGILCILITFLFLRDWTTTAIISTAIPICLVVTFAVMNVAGVSLNLMSLGGLALGVSMVVDSGTVVLESVQRHIDNGVPRKLAAVSGTQEVATAVFASVLTGIAVFFPIVFVEGVAGQIFGDLALTVVFSLATSLVVALVFIPMLAAREVNLDEPGALTAIQPFDRREVWALFRGDLKGEGRWRWVTAPVRWPVAILTLMVRFFGGLGLFLLAVVSAWGVRLAWWLVQAVWRRFDRASVWLADWFLMGYGWSENKFAGWLLSSLRRPGMIVFWGLALFGGSLYGLGRVGAELIPTVHQGRFTVDAALPVGTPLDVTEKTAYDLDRQISALPGVRTVYTVVGSDGGANSRSEEGENTAKILVELEPGGDLAHREAALMEEIRGICDSWPRLTVHFQAPALFSFHTPLEVVIFGNDLDVLKKASEQVKQELGGMEELADVRSSLSRGYPEVRIRYDRERLARLGLPAATVAQSIRNKVQGAVPTRIHQSEKRLDLLLRLDERDRASLAELGELNVNPALVPSIRLDSIARLEQADGPSEIRRVDQRRAVVLSASMNGFDLSGASKAVESVLRSMDLDLDFEVAGQSRELETSMASLQLALGLAIFLVYVIMASTFESLRDPLIILFSVPLALIGVAFGLYVTGNPVSVMVFLGMIVLAGVVVANAIVLVDAINRLRSEGLAMQEAIQAAAAERLRPILITALNSVLGLLPLALGLGEGSEIQRPMAITVIAGLASSTFLTLVIIPVVYQAVAQVTERKPDETPA